MNALLLTIVSILISCGTENVSPDDGATKAEKAQKSMNAGDYPTAIKILEPLLEEEPENYRNYTLLAAAYAGRAKVTVLDVLEAQLAGSDEGGSFLSMVMSILPEGYDDDDLADVTAALTLLYRIPAANRGSDGDPVYGESAELQIIIYNAIYAAMLLKKYTNAAGKFDQNSVDGIGPDEAAPVIAALESMAAEGTGEGGLSEGAQSALDDIDASSGSNDAERLQSYLEAQ